MPTSDDVTIENVREPHVGNRASPYTASNAHAVRIGGVPTDSNGTNNDNDYSRAWRPSSSPSASTASRTFDYKPTTHTRFETSSPTSDGAQFTFLEQLRRDAAGRGGGGTIGDATRYEPKTTFNHGYANHWDAPESGSPVRDVVTSIGAIGTLAAGNVAAPADVGTREARRQEAMEYDFNWREKEIGIETTRVGVGATAPVAPVAVPEASFAAASPNFSEASYSTPKKPSPPPREKVAVKAKKEDSWSFPVADRRDEARDEVQQDVRFARVASPEQSEPFVSPTSSASTRSPAPWSPSPVRTPLGTRIPPNSPASARTRKNLEQQMRRAAAWAAGEDTLIRRRQHEKGINKVLNAKRGFGAKMYRLAVAVGHVKAFMKSLDSARVEKAHGGGAKLAIVALCANAGIQAAHSVVLSLSAKLGEKFMRRVAIPQAIARRAAPLLLPATLASMGRTDTDSARGVIANAAAAIVPPLSLATFIGALWPIPGGAIVGAPHEHYGMINHDVFLDAFPWVNGILRRLHPATNALAILASIELMSTGEVHAENGALALIVASILSFTLAPPTNRVTMNFREVRAATQLVFMLSLSHAECAWREASVWRRYLTKRQGGLEGAAAIDRKQGGALAGIGGFTRAAARMPRLNRRPADTRKPARKSAPKPKPARHAKPTTKVAARPAKSKPQPESKPSRTVARRSRDDDDDDDLLERIQQRLPVIGPVLIILGGFVF